MSGTRPGNSVLERVADETFGTADAEFELLRACARRSVEEEGVARVEALIGGGLDWGRLTRMAARHGLIPLTYWHLVREDRFEIPEGPSRTLREVFRANAFKALSSLRESSEIRSLLSGRGIMAVPYKGPTLSVQVYGEPSLRLSQDIDLVVEVDDLEGVRETLVADGYREVPSVEPSRRGLVRGILYSQTFVHAERHTVEVHWRFTNREIAFPIKLEDLWPGLTQLEIGGLSVPAFSPSDLMLLLSVHGAKHRWDRLEWVMTLAEIARRLPRAHLDDVVGRARSLHVERMLLLSLALVRRYGDVALTEDLAGRIDRESFLRPLEAEVADLLSRDRMTPESALRSGSLGHDLFHLRLRDGLGEKTRFLAYRWTTPSRIEQWRTISIMGRVFPVHVLTRPLRVLGKLVPALYWRFRERARVGQPDLGHGGGRPGSGAS